MENKNGQTVTGFFGQLGMVTMLLSENKVMLIVDDNKGSLSVNTNVTDYADTKNMVKGLVCNLISNCKQFNKSKQDVAMDMAEVVAQAIREATKEDNNG